MSIVYNCIITSVYLIGELIIGFGALLAKHFCTADTLVAEILLANRNMSIEARRRRLGKIQERNTIKNGVAASSNDHG